MVPGTVKDQITLYDVSITDEDVIEAPKAKQVFMMQLWNLTMDMILYASQKISHRDSGSYCQLQGLQKTKPELLLLDEITTNLDADTEKNVLDALNRVSKNRTVISISHRTNARTGRIIRNSLIFLMFLLAYYALKGV